MKKRVVCFYRVSTKQQVIDDDIPVQRNACLEFISKHLDWEFCGEYIEKGVSGFKVHANEREKLEELKTDAIEKKFDIVLVFMFDRLGRIEEETPFVLKWFVDNNIEMWSVNEGQRKFDNHVDNLLNYITFWQASGESKKTQLRTLEAKRQMVDEGRFQGCAAPYGYKHISTGRHNSKGREIKELVIDEKEAKVVKVIFDLMTEKGYGSRRIASYLNDNGIPTKRGKLWAEATVMSILKNSMYKGFFTYGRRKSTENGRIYKNQYDCQISNIKNDELIIISENQWEEVKKIIEARTSKHPQLNVPRQTKSPLLLTGLIYCRKCGGRMTLHYSYNHYKRKDGTYNRNKKPFYICYNKSMGLNKCTNKNYAYAKIDSFVIKYICDYLKHLEKADLSKEFHSVDMMKIKQHDKDINNLKNAIKKKEEDLTLLKNEIIKVIKGESLFSQEILNEQINIKIKELEDNKTALQENIKFIEEFKTQQSDYETFQRKIPNYLDVFLGSEPEKKRMLIPKFISNVKVDENNIDIEVNIQIKELVNK